jgi:diamine N-acetyltransferase
MQIRPLVAADYDVLSPLLDDWWGGRPVRQLLPRLFFEHFTPTSFALEDAGQPCAFLVGLRSQARPQVAYIHFVGVAPGHRGRGLGRRLYTAFFERVATLGCTEVHCITSPVNTGSVAFHRRLGFEIVDAGGEQDGIRVSLDHAGPGQHRVLLRKALLREAVEPVDAHRVSLRAITADTLRAVVGLSVAETQKGFVATNAISLAQALFAPEAWYRAIYCDEDPVGFVMLEDQSLCVPAPPEPEIGVWRLMIDARHQRRGIGRAAMLRVIEHVRSLRRFKSLQLSYVPGPGSPEGFYLGLGFRPTGRVEENEIVLELPL